MNKALFFILFLTASATCWGVGNAYANVQVQSQQMSDSTLIDLHFNIIGGPFGPRPKAPTQYPSITQDVRTLIINSGCDNTTLAIVDDTDLVVYSADIEEGCDNLTLPSWLTGTFRLQITRGSLTFEAEIEL